MANLPREQRAQAMEEALAEMRKQPTQGDTDLAFAKMSLKNLSDGPVRRLVRGMLEAGASVDLCNRFDGTCE